MIDNSNVLVIVPAYNESLKIEEVLDELCLHGYHVLLVDDGSTDDTFVKAKKYRITILRHVCNLGQGAALQTGISYALLNLPDLEYIVTFDADGQHGVEDIETLISALREGNYDIVLGSRFMEQGRAVNMNRSKFIALKLAVLFSRITTGLKTITDTHNGLRAFTRSTAGKIHISLNGMAHASEILNQIAKHKLKFREVPVTILYSEYSKTKGQSFLDSINILWDTFVGRLR